MRIVSGSGKIRDGEPHDDKKDLRRDDIVDKVWTGVIPMWEKMGEAVASKSNRVKDVPDYISSFRTESNKNGESYARKAAYDH